MVPNVQLGSSASAYFPALLQHVPVQIKTSCVHSTWIRKGSNTGMLTVGRKANIL